MNYNPVNNMYASLLDKIMLWGDTVHTRNSKVKRVHTYAYTFHAAPLVTLRRTAWKSALEEMRWFLSGSNNINDLGKNVQKWWTPWADKQGVVKYNYGEQLRHWYGEEEFDQLKSFIYGIKNHPFSRRNVMTTWNASDMNNAHCPITNCHGTIIQAFVRESQVGLKNILDITMYQRSVDVICGLPHNWIQYWAFLQWLAKITGHVVGSFYWIGGDIHIYEQHFDLAKKLARLSEEFPKASGYVPTFLYNPVPDETQFKPADFSLSHPYEPLCSDHAEMIV